MYVTLNSSDFEQGTIMISDGSLANNYPSQARTKEYIPFTGYKGGITISASSFSGRKMQVYLFCFKGNVFVAASSWNDSPYTYDKITTDFDNIKVIVRYATQETIYPDDIKSVTVDAPFTWAYKDGVPLPIANQILPTDYSFPEARWTWRYSADGIPYNGFMPISEPAEPKGAFRNCTYLERVYIPESVKYIGKEAFFGTALKTVKIAADCEYSPTSFPDDCIVEFYGGGGDYVQLYDRDGYAVLDSEAARIYVKTKRGDTMPDEIKRLERSTEELDEDVNKIELMQKEIAELKERISALENK